ncbi:uncharacterized protein LOC112123233, partial [Terrapene carolina triunguis]|uniref:uncharacterized protein LOC112123233 n=1 Tax=Terrapene triunguis TaxID=2587831 RepID=UPI0011564AF8
RTDRLCCRLSAVDESRTSLTSHSDISYDRTEDDVDLDVTVVKPLKRKSQERPRSSLAPLIGPVVAAKRTRPPVLPAASASEPPGTLPAGAVAEDGGRDRRLLPAVPVLGRRSRQGRRLSTLTELTTVWGSSEDSDGRPDSGAGLEPRGLDPFPSPPQGAPPPQHLFTSKTVGSSAGDPPRVLLRLRHPCPVRAGGAAVPALPPAAAPRVPRALPQSVHPGPPAPPPGGCPGRLCAPRGPPGARPGAALRERGGAQGPDGDRAVPGARRGAAGAGVEAEAAAGQGGAAHAEPRGRRARGVWGAEGLPEGPQGAAGHLPPAPHLPAGCRHPGRGRLPGSPVPRGEQTAPRQPGHTGLPHAAPPE